MSNYLANAAGSPAVSSKVDAALAHAKAGFSVFPIAPNSKSPPLINNWPNLATNDTRQIETWWAEWPDANIGICTSGLLVVDIDPDKGGERIVYRFT